MSVSGCKEYSFTDVQSQQDQAQATECRGYSCRNRSRMQSGLFFSVTLFSKKYSMKGDIKRMKITSNLSGETNESDKEKNPRVGVH